MMPISHIHRFNSLHLIFLASENATTFLIHTHTHTNSIKTPALLVPSFRIQIQVVYHIRRQEITFPPLIIRAHSEGIQMRFEETGFGFCLGRDKGNHFKRVINQFITSQQKDVITCGHGGAKKTVMHAAMCIGSCKNHTKTQTKTLYRTIQVI